MKLFKVTFHSPYRTGHCSGGFCYMEAENKEEAIKRCLGKEDHIWIEDVTEVQATLIKQGQ